MYPHPMAKAHQTVIPIERIATKIYLIRSQKVMLDRDLADLYGVTTSALNQAVSRNKDRFPADFMFQLTKEELENWKSQIVISNPAVKMALRKPPRAFTEHGVAMLSSVLRSRHAVQINISIIRAFVTMREILATHKDVARKVEQLDRKVTILYDTFQKLMQPEPSNKKPIGYIWRDE
jgi:ORF6N domain